METLAVAKQYNIEIETIFKRIRQGKSCEKNLVGWIQYS